MKLSHNIVPLTAFNFFGKKTKTEPQTTNPKMKPMRHMTLTPSLLNKGSSSPLSDEEIKALFERLKKSNPISRNET